MADQPAGASPGAEPAPALIAGKYKSQDELIKAHEQLQTTLGQQSQELGVLRKQPKPAEWGENDGAEAVFGKLGVKPADLATHVKEKKALPSEVAAKAKELGLPPKVIQEMIDAQNVAAQIAGERNALSLKIAQDRAGGADKLKTIMAWAEKGLTAEQANAINAKIGRVDTMDDGIKELLDAYGKGANAPTGTAVGVLSTGGVQTGTAFESTRDMNTYRAGLHKRGIDPDSHPEYLARLAKTPEWVVRGGARR